jgi:hypothetical protein
MTFAFASPAVKINLPTMNSISRSLSVIAAGEREVSPPSSRDPNSARGRFEASRVMDFDQYPPEVIEALKP